MKGIFFGLMIGLCSTLSYAQTDIVSGHWEVYTSDFHYSEPLADIHVNRQANSIRVSRIEGKSTSSWQSQTQRHNVSNSQFSYIWNVTDGDTIRNVSLNVVAAGYPYFLYGVYQKTITLSDPNAVSQLCFYMGGCVFASENVYLKPDTKRIVLEDQITVGASTQDRIQLEEVRFTDKATEVLIFFESRSTELSGYVRAPGHPSAFFMRDSQGNRFDLMSQFGWPGMDEGGFGNYVIPAENEQHVILYFEPVDDPESITNFSMIEGTCESGCWNFYDVRLKD